jgi:sulfite exporter TauE/SafE/copper chaperone CopZ
MKEIFEISGMSCNSCAEKIEDALKDKVDKISANYSEGKAEIIFDTNKISGEEIIKIINKLGYEAEMHNGKKTKKSIFNEENIGFFVMIGSIILLIAILYYYATSLGYNIEIPNAGENAGLILLFVAGILTGFHCIAMCGGFVVSYTTKNAIKGHKGYKQHLVYGGSKLFSYALIGGIFGLIGGVFAFSVGLRGFIAIFAGVFMIFYALSMFGFKFFRKFQFNPKFLSKFVAKGSKQAKGPYKAPLITGLLSGLFIACGPLQAMYLYAMGTGSFFSGMLSLAAFGLGTLPVMIGFGSIATSISHKTTKRILKIAAILVLILGIIMLNRGLTVLGSSVSFDSIKGEIIGRGITESAVLINGYQEIDMEVTRSGWQPNSFVLKKGVPVKWNINVKELTGCNNEIIVKDYNLNFKLKSGLNVIEFTPDKTGTVRWSCWMGMIPGSFVVTETGQASQQEIAQATPKSSGGCGCGG